MTAKEDIDTEKRCFLRKATMTVGGIGLAATALPFVSYWLPSADTEAAGEPIQFDTSLLKPEEQKTILWRGMPIWIIRRTPEMITNLSKLNDKLRDPESVEDQQPPYAQNLYRSIKPDIFVAIGICTHLGCIPTYRPDVGSITPAWLGGFYCPCHGSMYDLAGRVYKDVPAPLNLKIPPYGYVDEHNLMIGEHQAPAQTKR